MLFNTQMGLYSIVVYLMSFKIVGLGLLEITWLFDNLHFPVVQQIWLYICKECALSKLTTIVVQQIVIHSSNETSFIVITESYFGLCVLKLTWLGTLHRFFFLDLLPGRNDNQFVLVNQNFRNEFHCPMSLRSLRDF